MYVAEYSALLFEKTACGVRSDLKIDLAEVTTSTEITLLFLKTAGLKNQTGYKSIKRSISIRTIDNMDSKEDHYFF